MLKGWDLGFCTTCGKDLVGTQADIICHEAGGHGRGIESPYGSPYADLTTFGQPPLKCPMCHEELAYVGVATKPDIPARMLICRGCFGTAPWNLDERRPKCPSCHEPCMPIYEMGQWVGLLCKRKCCQPFLEMPATSAGIPVHLL